MIAIIGWPKGTKYSEHQENILPILLLLSFRKAVLTIPVRGNGEPQSARPKMRQVAKKVIRRIEILVL